jgi:hypothetical protein
MASIAALGQKSDPANTFEKTSALKEQIAKEAYQLYLERGGHDGYDHEDWLRAEVIVESRR